ncbi:hypothetical protein EGW08_005346 [Elysia chlorotica]|uniref:Uncharacterized protein n=1 Tax=Elysia chlorotica TaxID=188477 RepID=A0A3S1BRE8_ELYCH|nr:hypothetical protein EGW08_005346 [Elysia chlorotica]
MENVILKQKKFKLFKLLRQKKSTFLSLSLSSSQALQRSKLIQSGSLEIKQTKTKIFEFLRNTLKFFSVIILYPRSPYRHLRIFKKKKMIHGRQNYIIYTTCIIL